jgi:hypothetical protein
MLHTNIEFLEAVELLFAETMALETTHRCFQCLSVLNLW